MILHGQKPESININTIYMKSKHTFLRLLFAILISTMAFAGCTKEEAATGTLTVTVWSPQENATVSVYPYETDFMALSPIASVPVSVKDPVSDVLTFELLPGNYIVRYLSDSKGVQVIAGTNTKIQYKAPM